MICVSSNDPAPKIRGPRDCVWFGSSSYSPVYFGLGKAFASEKATEAIFIDADIRGEEEVGTWWKAPEVCRQSKPIDVEPILEGWTVHASKLWCSSVKKKSGIFA